MAPARMRLSTHFLFTAAQATRSQKSNTSRNAPPAARSETMAWMAPWPRFFTPAKPKRMAPSSTENFSCERFTSGGSTRMPRFLQVWM